MQQSVDPFSGIESDQLRQSDNLKWHRYPDDVLPAWIADMDAPLCPAVADALAASIAVADDGGSFGYPSDELVASVVAAFGHRMQSRFDWTPGAGGVRLVTDIVGTVTHLLDHVSVPGDGVVVQTPVYPPFLEQIEAMGRVPIHHGGGAETGEWSWPSETLDALIDDRTRVLVLVNPHNPTGRVLRREELAALAEIACRRDLVVISDEIHADLTFDDAHHIPFASLGPDVAARTVTLTSAAKSFNLAGLRCAVAHYGSDELLAAATRLPHPWSGMASTLGMIAVRAAWTDGDAWLDEVVGALADRRAMLRSFLDDHLPEVDWVQGDGTYLAWLDFRQCGLGDDPAAFFLANARVALGSGLAYGPPGAGFARLNFATSAPLLGEMLERMVTALDLRRAG